MEVWSPLIEAKLKAQMLGSNLESIFPIIENGVQNGTQHNCGHHKLLIHYLWWNYQTKEPSYLEAGLAGKVLITIVSSDKNKVVCSGPASKIWDKIPKYIQEELIFHIDLLT